MLAGLSPLEGTAFVLGLMIFTLGMILGFLLANWAERDDKRSFLDTLFEVEEDEETNDD